MVMIMVGAMALLGGTAWLAMQQSVARDPVLNHRLTAAGLLSCLAVAVVAVTAAVMSR